MRGFFYDYLTMPKSSPEYERLDETLDVLGLPLLFYLPVPAMLAAIAGHILGRFIVKEKIKFKGGKFPVFPFNIAALVCFWGFSAMTLFSTIGLEFMVTMVMAVVYIVLNAIVNWGFLSWLANLPVVDMIPFLFYLLPVFSLYATLAILIFTLAYLAAGYFHTRQSLTQ